MRRGVAKPGLVYIVGAGPGDPELLTLKAARLIESADDLVVDALVPLALYRSARGRVVYVGKRAGRPRIAQEDIGRILVDLALAGRTVVRLKGGDPGVFGRAAEEIEALDAHNIAWEMVPGVSSALAAPALVGVALTARGTADRLLIVSGHARAEACDTLPTLLPFDSQTTVVVLMGLGQLEALVDRAKRVGFPAELPAVVVSQAGTPEQKHVATTLNNIVQATRDASLMAPATLILGRVNQRALQVAQERGNLKTDNGIA